MERPGETKSLAEAVFSPTTGASLRSPLSLLLKGTNFQIKVWNALLRIPPGSVTTYGGLAEALGAPKSTRPVGSAVGKNPIAYLIPCHRVIRAMGEFGQYRWGAVRKKAILGWEAARRASDMIAYVEPFLGPSA
jgi:AraC family transcriptional regulator of adaptative response/methylated-DNA-[protein]-cysteine methyltransferase